MLRAFLSLFLLLLLPLSAFGAGFQLLEQSGEGVGNAFAGATAGYGDGSEVAFNPAGMAWLDRTQISHSSQVIIPSSDFESQGSSNVLTGVPTMGSDDDGGQAAYVPSFYVVHPLSDSIHAGFGIHTPFGLATEYSRDWVGRYHGVESELVNINLSPAVSYKLNDSLSFGAAANIGYVDATLSNAIDFGTIGLASLGPATASALGLAPQQADGFGKATADDWGYGYTLGASYRLGDSTTIGLAYHSKISYEANGDAEFEVPANAMPLTAGGFFTNSSASADVTLPEWANLGFRHEINSKWAILGEAAWTRWSRFETLRVRFGNGQPDSVTEEDWNNTWRYSAAINYMPQDNITLKAGFTYDETPIPGADRRTPRIPGNDRRWLAFGVAYDVCENIQIGLDYAHLFVSDARTNITNSTGDNLIGRWDASVDIVAISGTYVF